MSQREITVTKRTVAGKEASKVQRREGLLPAVLYGHGQTPVTYTVNAREFTDLIHHHGLHALLVLKGEGGGETAIIKAIQKHPVKGIPAAIDFLRVSRDEKISLTVALVLDGEPLGVKTGDGVLVQSLHEIQVQATPDNLPEAIHVDISGLETDGPALTVGAIVPPAGVIILTDASEAVAAVNLPAVVKEEEPAAEPAAVAETEAPVAEAEAPAEAE